MDFNLTCIGVRISPRLNRLQIRINARIDQVCCLPCVGSSSVCKEHGQGLGSKVLMQTGCNSDILSIAEVVTIFQPQDIKLPLSPCCKQY